MTAKTTPWALLAATAVLTACGGGGGGGGSDSNGPPPVVKLEGAYQGTTTPGEVLPGVDVDLVQGRIIRSLTLENGDSWVLYGDPKVNGTVVAVGMTHATLESDDGFTYTARTKDYYKDGQVFNGRLSGRYVAGQSFRGTMNASNGLTPAPASFIADAVKASEYNYQTPASLPGIADTWSGGILEGKAGQISIDAAGALQGSFEACSVTGQVQPRASGKNVFDVTVDFGPAPCALPGQQTKGIAVTYASGAQLVVMAATADGAAGTAFLVSR